MSLSRAEIISLLGPSERRSITKGIPPEVLEYMWEFWGRPEQLEPNGDWSIWLIMAGRGFGKSRTGSEWCRKQARKFPGSIGALIGRTSADVRDVMVEGPAGLLRVSPKKERPKYEPSKRRVVWPNGTIAMCYSADEPDQLRGPQHHWVWGDEFASWYNIEEIWSNVLMGLRMGNHPRAILTTTPRPVPQIKKLIHDPTVHITRGSTYDNSGNLPKQFIDSIIRRYEGTRLGKQELYAEILDDVAGALWKLGDIEIHRVQQVPKDLKRVVVAIDPATTHGPDSDETGIIGGGVDALNHGYVIEDVSMRGSPIEWANAAVRLFHKLKADLIVAEGNQGGEMVSSTIRSIPEGKDIPIKIVHARRGKFIRAEPVSALYEQGRVHHVGLFPKLEDQLTGTDFSKLDKSPDRLDALVYMITDLIIDGPLCEPRIELL